MPRHLLGALVVVVLTASCGGREASGGLRDLGGAEPTFAIDEPGNGKCQFDYRATVSALDTGTGREVWSQPVPWTGGPQPAALGDGLVVVTSVDHPNDLASVLAMRADDGRPVWQRDLRAGPRGFGRAPIIVDSTVVVIDGEQLVGLALPTGRQRWRTALGQEPSIEVRDATIYASAFDGSIAAIDATSGAKRWRVAPERSDGGSVGLALVGDLVIGGTQSGELLAVDRASGRVRWRRPNERGRYWYPVVPGDDRTVLVGDNAGSDPGVTPHDTRSYVEGLDLRSGEELWRAPLDDAPRDHLSVVRGVVLDLDPSGRAPGLDVRTGVPVADPPVREAEVSEPAPGLLIAKTPRAGTTVVHRLDAVSGAELWSREVDGDAALPTATAGDRLVLGTTVHTRNDSSGTVVALRLTDGAVLWQTDRERPAEAAVAIDGPRAIVVSADLPLFCD